ncbi:MAG: sialate O-acetylesterase [Phycisphaerae bacterium]
MVKAARLILFVVGWVFVSSVGAEVTLPSIFSDHMVLQQGKNVPIWGWGLPGENVTVYFQDQKKATQAERNGTWRVELNPLKAGGPFELKVIGNNSLFVKDAMVGEVWLASGQSNMAMPVSQADNASKEISQAKYPTLRMFTVSCKNAAQPRTNVMGKWVLCYPNTVKDFSATAYFFGRKIHKDLKNVPVGLINSSVSGSRIEGWIPRSAYAVDPKLKQRLGLVELYDRDSAQARKVFDRQYAEWEQKARAKDPGNVGFSRGYADTSYDASGWSRMILPGCWERYGSGYQFNGAVWFRRVVEVPTAWTGKDIDLHLGAVDDFDTAYFNGVKVGQTDADTPNWWAARRVYKIPGACVKPRRNILAVRVFDAFLDGGFRPEPNDMNLVWAPQGQEIPISGVWQYRIEWRKDVPEESPPLFPGSRDGPASLFNGMIYPIVPFAIRGVIWYQGESNTQWAHEYPNLLRALIQGWRSAWKQGNFPFLVVQLPNFMPLVPWPVDSNWARLREAQTAALNLPNTGLAVTIDVGDGKYIHPPNKQEVGRRLALLAEKIAYNRNIIASGPMFKSIKVSNGKLIICFDSVGGGLVAGNGNKLTGFALCGADRKFVWAEARIERDRVIVWSDQVPKPVAVRYAWADNPECNLYNREGLPTAPFRTQN